MKTMQKLYKLLMVSTILFATIGCKKYLDINTNPAVPQVVKAELLLPPIEYQMTNGTSQDARVSYPEYGRNVIGYRVCDLGKTWLAGSQ